jgi:checkpoint serine/threonine-protein kinase
MESLFSPVPCAPSSSSPPDAAPTTDFSLIESQKENIRPLATGRSAATLSTLFEKDSEAERVIAEGHESWKAQIEEAERREREGEDMMDGMQDLLEVYNKSVLLRAAETTHVGLT